MLNRNLVPVYYDQDKDEFVADFSSRSSSYTRGLNKAAKDMRGKNATQRRQALDVRNNVDSNTLTAKSPNTQINAARQRRLAEESARNTTRYSSLNNKIKASATKANTPAVRGILGRIGDAALGTTRAGKIARGIAGVGALGAGAYGVRAMNKRNKDRRYGGLGRYVR